MSENFKYGFLIGSLFVAIIVNTADLFWDDRVYSKKPIQYELKIKVDQSGKADTTYIYREPNN